MGLAPRLSSWKYVTFAIITLMLSVFVISGAILGLDLYLHKRYEKRWRLNVWGYRGPVVGPKRPGEIRIVVLGGSTALGFDLPAHQAHPPYLDPTLTRRDRNRDSRAVT